VVVADDADAAAVVRLSADVKYLSVTVGERNIQRAGSLKAIAECLSDNLRRAGYVVAEQNYSVDGQVVSNVEVTLPWKR
jgi:hypothetical protein